MSRHVSRWSANPGAALVAAIALTLAAPSTAVPAAGAEPHAQQLAQAVPIYQPPMRGAPQGRVGGATRGAAEELPQLDVLAPDHVGLTTAEQPTLYWFISKPVKQKVQITLASEKSVKPVLEVDLEQPPVAGINAIRLADYNIRLEPNVEYEWSVAVVPDQAQRSNDLLASGIVKRVPAPPALTQKLGSGQGEQTAAIYAENGIWYDAIEALSRAIERQPGNAALRQSRAALLDQVGLKAAAAFEKRGGG